MSMVPARRANILVIGPTPPPFHGVAGITPYILEALAALECLGAHLDTRDPQPLETLGSFNRRNVTLGLRHAWRLHRLLRRAGRPTVLLPISQGTWGFMRDAAFVLVVRLHRCGLILHLHGAALAEFYKTSGPLICRIIRAVFRQADFGWALTPNLETMFAGLVPVSRVRHLENVVPAPPAGISRGDSDGSENDSRFRVLYLSNLRHNKGVFDLLEALREIGSAASNWQVRIVGAGSKEVVDALEARASQLRESGGAQVNVLPPQYDDDKWAEFQAADVFVFSPRAAEGQPLVLLEAMASELPIVSTSIGGIPDTVHDGVQGILVPPADPPALGEALGRLSDESDLRNSLRMRGHTTYEQRYKQ